MEDGTKATSKGAVLEASGSRTGKTKWTEEEVFQHWEDPSKWSLNATAMPLETVQKIYQLEIAIGKQQSEETKELEEQRHQMLKEVEQYISRSKEVQQKLEEQMKLKTKKSRIVADSAEDPAERDLDLDSELVPPAESMLGYPHRSVGKLFRFRPGTSEISSYVTAFYIGKKRIMTAAHAFDNDHAGMFVPAMLNNHDIYGYNYGYYPVTGVPCVHPKYLRERTPVWTPEYDICTVEIGMGKRMKKIPRSIFRPNNWFVADIADLFVSGFRASMLTGINIDEVGLRKILCEPIPSTPDATWIALGYEKDGNGGLSEKRVRQVIDQQNTEVMVSRDPLITRRLGNEVTVMDTELNSGAPWILESSMSTDDAIATGCQVEANRFTGWVISPRFSEELFAEIPHFLPRD
jgi:hypothetical protein